MEATSEKMVGCLTMLNKSGDSTLAWDESGEDNIKRLIEAKLHEGVTFFILEPRLDGKMPPTKNTNQKHHGFTTRFWQCHHG